MSDIRDAPRTRRLILDAAAKCLADQGTGCSLAAVAQVAGVSKSGLLHHYPARDDLMRAVMQDSVDRFRAEILRFVDLSENYPGKVLRAYVRALCGGSDEAMLDFAHTSVWNQLSHVPGVEEMQQRDLEEWDAAFAQDGLDPDRVLVVKHAAEGVVGSRLYDPTFTETDLRRVRELLIGLTLPSQGPLVTPIRDYTP